MVYILKYTILCYSEALNDLNNYTEWSLISAGVSISVGCLVNQTFIKKAKNW